MVEVVVFPDVTLIAIDYLRTEFTSRGETAELHREIPNPRPAKFVRVLRVGGTRSNLVTDGATVTIECWAATYADAQDLAQLCRGLLHAMTGTVQHGAAVYHVEEFSGPADLPDPDSNQARATQTMQIQVRGAAA